MCVCSVAQSHLTLCNIMDCSLSGSSIHGILQARILEWVVISSSRGSSWPRDQTCLRFPAGMEIFLAGMFFTIGATWEAQASGTQIKAEVAGPEVQLFRLCDIVSHFVGFFLFLHSLFCPIDLFLDLNANATLILQLFNNVFFSL